MSSAASTPKRHEVLGLPIDVCPDVLTAAVELHRRGGGQLVTLNAEMTMTALEQAPLGAAIHAAQLVIPDGAGVVWALKRQGIQVQRSPGIELADALLAHAAHQGWRVALVGASPAVMSQLQQQLPQRHRGLQLVMAVHGYQPADAGLSWSDSCCNTSLIWCWPRWGSHARKPGCSACTRTNPGCGWVSAEVLMCGQATRKGPPAGWEPSRSSGFIGCCRSQAAGGGCWPCRVSPGP